MSPSFDGLERWLTSTFLLSESGDRYLLRPMANAESYRPAAKRCRGLVAHTRVAGSIMRERWLTIGAEYDAAAEAIARAPVRAQTHQLMRVPQKKATENAR